MNEEPVKSSQENKDPKEVDQDSESNQSDSLVESSNPQPSRYKKLALVFLAVLLVAAGGYVLFNELNNTQSVQEADKDPITNSNNVVCAFLSDHAIQCEDLSSGELSKYEMPELFSNNQIRSFVPSPDGSKYIVDYYSREQDSVTKTVVINQSFEVLKELEPYDTFEEGDYINEYVWLTDSTGIVRLKNPFFRESNTEKGVLSVVSLSQNSEDKIIAEDIEQEYHLATADSERIYLTKSQVVDPDDAQAQSTQLAAIEMSGGEIMMVDTSETDYDNGVQIAGDGMDYSWMPEQSLFYISSQTRADDSSKPFFVVAKLEDAENGGLKLRKISQLDIYYDAWASPEPIITSKGILARLPENDQEEEYMGPKYTYPYTVINSEGVITSLSLAFSGGEVFATSSFPELKKHDNPKAEPADFLTYPKDTPKPITDFAATLTTKDCETGNYMRVTIVVFDGEDQFAGYIGGCQGYEGYYYFKKSGETYKELTGTQEGISCSERDGLGISAVIEPNCRTDDAEGL